MKKKKNSTLSGKIKAGVEAAIARLYKDAKKNKLELVILENGKIKKIRP